MEGEKHDVSLYYMIGLVFGVATFTIFSIEPESAYVKGVLILVVIILFLSGIELCKRLERMNKTHDDD